MKKQNRFQKGMTLTEVLVAVAISTLIVSAAYFASVTGQKTYKATEERIELSQNARISLDRMSREIRQATEIASDLPSTPDLPGNPPKTEIMFEDGHTATIRYIRYYLQDNSLRRTIRAFYFGPSLPLDESEWVDWNARDNNLDEPKSEDIEDEEVANFISSVQFYGDTTITVDLVASQNNTTYHFNTSILPRNL